MPALPRLEYTRPAGCALATAVAAVLTIGVFRAGAQDAAQPAFEVASVKLHVSGSGGGRSSPGRFATWSSLTLLIKLAYGLESVRQVVGPDWANSLLLDIDAKLPEGATKEQIPQMLRTLLADRMKLVAHEESRTMPVYELKVAKDGSKMKQVEPARFLDQVLRYRGTHFRGHMTTGQIAGILSDYLDRDVLDSTGLKAIYDVDLHWSQDQASAPPGGGDSPPPIPVAIDGPNIFQAIQQQLGLKLDSGRAPFKVVVVDHVERIPTAN